MIEVRPFDRLGGASHGWLNAKHHFSFASYHDPNRMGWGSLRVWNDDEIPANTGFPPHSHADMEIIQRGQGKSGPVRQFQVRGIVQGEPEASCKLQGL
jgi:Pirin